MSIVIISPTPVQCKKLAADKFFFPVWLSAVIVYENL